MASTKQSPFLLLGLWIIALSIPIVAIIIQHTYLLPSIANAFDDRYDPFIKFIQETFYPRFSIEKHRFTIDFFYDKVNQLIARFLLVYSSVILVYWGYRNSPRLKHWIEKLQYTATSFGSIRLMTLVYFSFMTYTALDLCVTLIDMQPLSPFYKPVLWLSFFSIGFPSTSFILVIGALWIASISSVLLHIRPVAMSTVSAGIFIVVQSWLYSFEKYDHGYVTVTFIAVLFPFLLEESASPKPSLVSWSLSLMRIAVALSYFLSGLEKLVLSGTSWLSPETLITYLRFHETPLANFIAGYPLLCILISSSTLFFQLSFIFILVFPKKAWVWILGGIAFHTGTLLVMDIGHPLNPWIIAYLIFINWKPLYDYSEIFFKKGIRSKN